MIKQIAHICFGCRDLLKSIEFYSSLFGFEIVHEYRNENNVLYGVFLSCGGNTYLELFNDQESIAKGGLFRHVCFEVTDLNLLIQKFSSLNISFEKKRGRSDKTLQAFIFDPDGNKIEFHQYDKRSILRKSLDDNYTAV